MKERLILAQNNICMCDAQDKVAGLGRQMCFMYCGLRQDASKEEIETILKEKL